MPVVSGWLGRTVAIDPGHNPNNWKHPAKIEKPVPAGGFLKACDTTGTESADGYTEAAFNFDVATRLARILKTAGATVALTRTAPPGPCINQRSAIGNRARADAAISIHADGSPQDGRGFDVIYPPDTGITRRIATASRRLAVDVRNAYAADTTMPPAPYVGRNGPTSAPTSAASTCPPSRAGGGRCVDVVAKPGERLWPLERTAARVAWTLGGRRACLCRLTRRRSGLISSDEGKPSDGLEPSTPSLP